MNQADSPPIASDHATDDQQEHDGTGPYRPGYTVAAERILEFIADRGLGPGDRLPTEAELGEQIGFSRAVTREAIKVLSALGRVSAHRGRGVFVADNGGLFSSEFVQRFVPTRIEDIAQLFEFRRTLESELTRLAATRGTPADIRKIEEAASRGRFAITHGTRQDKIDTDRAFHRAVAAAARNELLSAAREVSWSLQRQLAVIALAEEPGNVQAAADEHDAIARAIRRGEPDEAEAAAKAHLDRTYADCYQMIQQGMLAGPRTGANRADVAG